MIATVPPLTPAAVASLSGRAGAWMRSPDGWFAETVQHRFGLHPLEETDPRFYALAGGERVDVAAVPPLLLWRSERTRVNSVRHQGLIARALDAANAPYADLWLDGTAYAFLRGAPALTVQGWPRTWRAGTCWFSYCGTELYGLRRVWAPLGGRLIIDIERVVPRRTRPHDAEEGGRVLEEHAVATVAQVVRPTREL